MKTAICNTLLACAGALIGCTPGPESPRGFSLPEGDEMAGQVAFIDLRCNDCHSAAGVEQYDPENAEIKFELGGDVTRVTTYAELVTAIINPSHRLSQRYPEAQSAVGEESRMRNYNETMTVQQMIDLVAYLQPQYKVIVVTPTSYQAYYP